MSFVVDGNWYFSTVGNVFERTVSQGRSLPLSHFAAICCRDTGVAVAWQVRVHTWPSPSVNDLRVLDLAGAAISALGFILQCRLLTSSSNNRPSFHLSFTVLFFYPASNLIEEH